MKIGKISFEVNPVKKNLFPMNVVNRDASRQSGQAPRVIEGVVCSATCPKNNRLDVIERAIPGVAISYAQSKLPITGLEQGVMRAN